MITRVQRLNPDAVLPRYGYPNDAGMDLAVIGQHVLNPGESRDLPTGVAIQTPPGVYGRITGRSSTLRKRGLFVNEGVIDEGYRGELLVYVTNRQSTAVTIEPGDRLAQLVLSPVVTAPAEWRDLLDDSDRGTNGFGSTGGGVPAGKLSDLVDAVKAYQGRARYVYLGGAVDVGDDNHEWRHSPAWEGVATYCPICECKNLTDPASIIARNMAALYDAADAVFLFGAFSVGTPIEAWRRIVDWDKPAIIVWPHRERSVFIRYMTARGRVRVVDTLVQAYDLMVPQNNAGG